MKCKNCGTENPNDSKFCITCGQPLQTDPVPDTAPAEENVSETSANPVTEQSSDEASQTNGESAKPDEDQPIVYQSTDQTQYNSQGNPNMGNAQYTTQGNQNMGNAQFTPQGNPNTGNPNMGNAQFTPQGNPNMNNAQYNPQGNPNMNNAQYNPQGNPNMGKAQYNPRGNFQGQPQFNTGNPNPNMGQQFNQNGQYMPNGAPGQQRPPKQPLTPEQKKKYQKYGIFGGIAAAALVVIIVIAYQASHTINLNKYTKVTVEGYDTVGKASYDFDYDKFDKDYGKKIKLKKSSSDYGWAQDLYSALGGSAADLLLDECVDCSLDKSTDLSNGDEVTLKWDCNDKEAKKYFGYTLKHKDIKQKVSGLKKAEKFDPFDGVDVTFSGSAPNGKAEISGSSSEVSGLTYQLDKNSGLSNGDKVTLSVNAGYSDDPIEYCIENYGKIPSSTTKEYTVSGLSSYLNSAKDLSEDDINTLKNYAETEMNKRITDSWGDYENLVSMDYIGTYLQKVKDGTSYYWYENSLCMVYKIVVNDAYGDFNQDTTYYTYVYFKNVQTDADGKLVTTNMDYDLTSHTFTVDGGSHWWYYYGYETIDDMKNNLVDSDYDLEENITQ